MSGVEIGLISLGGILLLIYSGLHVAITLAFVSFIGIWVLRGDATQAARVMSLATRESISSYLFGVVPLFVLMGLVVARAGLGRDTFEVAGRALRRVTGGLGIATVAANAIFAAITGISIASAAVFTKVAVPEMIRMGYAPRFATGIVAGSSVLGMLLPPSLLLILYGILAEQSVGALFIAGIGPGVLLSLVYCLAIWLLVHFWHSYTGNPHEASEVTAAPAHGRFDTLNKLLPILLLIVLVLGGIYGGFFPPTEAGAVGAFGAVLIAAAKRRLNARTLWEVTLETGHVTAAICFLIIAATMYSRMLALSGLPAFLTEWVIAQNLGIYGFLACFVLLLILLGTILDSSSILLVTIPLALPIATSLGIDLIWFGLITVIAVEIGLLTPPMGLSVFVIKSSLDDERIPIGDIFAGTAPFALIMLAVLILCIAFPVIVTGLV
ncbi:TRAP transporter large permease [Paracoccus aerodenitrificans]|uniref:TRAP transporter large permease n=1 Tax=Paracoccus aerodenitrificans TaxID=3017781 RepID=UPI0022F068F7|nr:TRAP transporter large permease subunit [Paracoccus aerodenitrificans]WBU63553.1 TRAP transporter large permease subunit [Paracoccus aerodenitrificans]